jgi:hypothetical protein
MPGRGVSSRHARHAGPTDDAACDEIVTSHVGDWPAAQRVRWFRTFAMNVSQIYDDDEKPVEMKIDLDEAAN